MHAIVQDVRYSLRILLKSPFLMASACLTLAMGIGLNTMMFSVSKALLMRPLSIDNLERLVDVQSTDSRLRETGLPLTPADFGDLAPRDLRIESLAAYSPWRSQLTGIDEPKRIRGWRVTRGFFSLFGTDAQVGRVFMDDDSERGDVVLVSHGIWTTVLGSPEDLAGTTLQLNKRPFRVIGVLPRHFDFPVGADIWAPLVLDDSRFDRETYALNVVGKMRPGVSVSAVRTSAAIVASRLEEQYPETNAGRGLRVRSLRSRVVNSMMQSFIMTLFGAGGFVLLIACANVANLQLSRATGRLREISIRTALGASRARVLRQLFCESLFLALGGGAIGLLLGAWGLDSTKGLVPREITRFLPGWERQQIDGEVLVFTFLVAMAAAVVFGLMPAIQASRPDLIQGLKEGDRGSTGSRGGQRLRGFIVVVQVSISVVLLVGAGLMVSGFLHLMGGLSHGYDPNGLLTMRLTLPERTSDNRFLRTEIFRRFEEEVNGAPEIASASMVSRLPGTGDFLRDLRVEGRSEPSPGEIGPQAYLKTVGFQYFRTLGVTLLSGRVFEESDNSEAMKVAIVSLQAARKLWPGGEPIGERVRFPEREQRSEWSTVVGVVGDVKHSPEADVPYPAVYYFARQGIGNSMSFIARTAGEPLTAASAVREAVKRVAADQPVEALVTMNEVLAGQTSGYRVSAITIGIQGFAALFLTLVGIYSLTAFLVARRTHEIGVRIVLGAGRSEILRLVVGSAFRLSVVGLAIGIPGALAMMVFIESTLFGVIPLNWLILATFVLLILASALVSGYLPARRALRVDPILALRNE